MGATLQPLVVQAKQLQKRYIESKKIENESHSSTQVSYVTRSLSMKWESFSDANIEIYVHISKKKGCKEWIFNILVLQSNINIEKWKRSILLLS